MANKVTDDQYRISKVVQIFIIVICIQEPIAIDILVFACIHCIFVFIVVDIGTVIVPDMFATVVQVFSVWILVIGKITLVIVVSLGSFRDIGRQCESFNHSNRSSIKSKRSETQALSLREYRNMASLFLNSIRYFCKRVSLGNALNIT